MDYKKAVDDKKKELTDLHKRMDADADLVNLKAYTLKDVKEHDIPRSISVTLNDAAVFAANVESSLSNAVEQIKVESEDEKIETSEVEDAIRAQRASANYRRMKQGGWSLNPYFDQSNCRRGGSAARELTWVEDGQLITDITPWDRRYLYYAMGVDGLAWAAYEMEKTKDEIESEAWAQEKKFTISGTKANTLDIWTPEHNEIYVAGKKEYEQPHTYGYVPVCVQLVPMGTMLSDKDYAKYEGESIFFLIRDLIPELNRIASLIQSLNQKELDHALQWPSEEGKSAMPPKFADLDTPGTVVPTEKGGGAVPVPYGQLRQQAWLLHQMIETRVQRGSLSNFEYGTFTQPMSAVALIQVGEGRDQVFLPRLGARGLLNQQLAYMAIDQIIQTGLRSVEIGVRGHKRTFDVAKLEGEYDIEFNYFVKSPTIDMARIEAATAARNSGLYSGYTARRDIAQQEDAEEEERRISSEEIELLVPAIKLRRNIKDLYDLAEKGDEEAALDAELAEEALLNLIGQTGQPTPPRKESGQMLELLGKETGAKPEDSAQKASALKRTPVEEE